MKLTFFPRKPLVVAMMALPTASYAAAAEPGRELKEVVVAASAMDGYKVDKASSPKLFQPLKDLPRTLTVVPEKIIQEQGATTLADVLRNVSGISMAAGEGGVPAGDNLTIRGFGARTDIFVDGIRDNGGYTRDPFNLSSVEVFKGPSSAYSGRGSTGGSVNLVSKTPQRDNFTLGSTGIGTDNYLRQTFDINRTLGDAASARLNLLIQDNDVPGRNHVENRRIGVAPSLQLGQGTDTRTTLSLLHLEGDNTPDYGIPNLRTNNAADGEPGRPAPVSKRTWYGIKDGRANRDTTTTDMATVVIDHDLSAGQTLRQAFRYGRTDRDSRVIAPRFVTPLAGANLDIRRELKGRDAQDELFVSQTDLTSKFNVLDMQSTLVAGVELVREKSRARTFSNNGTTQAPGLTTTTTAHIPAANAGNPNPDDPFIGAIPAPDVGELTANSAAAYAFNTLALNKQWDVTTGARFDRFEVDYNLTPAGAAKSNFSRIDRMFSWNAGVVYKPVPAGSFYLGYGTSFNPSVEGLTLSAANIVATKALEPEKNRTVELGTKWSLLKNRLALAGALFRTDKSNARTVDPLNATLNVLDGEQRVNGGEVSVVGQIAPAWQVMASYTRLEGKVRSSNTAAEVGNELANTPRDTSSIWSTYQLSDKWQVGAGMQYVSERYTAINDTSRHLIPGFTKWDAMASYQASRNVNLRLNVYNLTNKDYIGTVGGGHGIPGAARSATLTASYAF